MSSTRTVVRTDGGTHIFVQISPGDVNAQYPGGKAILKVAEARALRDALNEALECDDLRQEIAAAQARLDARLARCSQ